MYLIRGHYSHNGIIKEITTTFNTIFSKNDVKPIFVCIGSDRHLLDCFGPLLGTMLIENINDIEVYGTLDKPIHAGNISEEINVINANQGINRNKIIIAIDACVGEYEDIGVIQVREGSIYPGRALAKKLPAIGDYAVTGTVAKRITIPKSRYSYNNGSLSTVYHMANILFHAIKQCDVFKR